MGHRNKISALASKNYGIMIYVGEMNETFMGKVGSEVQDNFPDLLKNGMIEIISPPKNYFPNFDEAKTVNLFGDSPDRIKWRQKQNLGNTNFQNLSSNLIILNIKVKTFSCFSRFCILMDELLFEIEVLYSTRR